MNENDIYFIVGQNIKKYRKIKGWTQLKLATQTYLSHEFIRKIESKSASRKQFSLDTAHKISKALEVDIRDLFNPIDE